ncbi:MAG: NlpC/P60 family protein [Telluria sp.]
MIGWGNYIGIPFADHGSDARGVDCWGLVRHVLACEHGWQLPSYGEGYDSAKNQAAVTEVIVNGLMQGWERVSAPVASALVVFRMAGKPWHVGLVVAPDRFLHAPVGETSCVERLSSPMWEKRIEGFYVRKETE